MDALDMLKSDHERVKSLYEQFKAASDRPQKASIFGHINHELESHSLVEDSIFYPAFKHYPAFDRIIEKSHLEHSEIEDELSRISNQPKWDNELTLKIEKLMSNVVKHYDEEEGQLFAMIRKVMKRSERERLGRHIQAVKQTAFGRIAA